LRAWLPYFFAVAATAATLLIRMNFGIAFGDRPLLILFLLPIILSAYLGGLGPGLVSTFGGALGVLYFLIPPIHTLGIEKTADLAQWIMLIVNGVIVSLLSEALHRSRQRARMSGMLRTATLSSISDAVVAVNPEGVITFLNPEAERLTGWGKEALGLPIDDLFRATNRDTAQPMRDFVKNMLETGEPSGPPVEVIISSKDGSERAVENTGAPVRSAAGVLEGVVLTFRDCTAKRAADATLRRNEARLRLAQEAAKAGTWEWNLRTNENFWSEELFKLYGLNPLTCKPSYDAWRESIHPEDRAEAERAVREAASSGRELNAEWRVCGGGGGERWLMSRGQPILDEDGGVGSFIGIAMDITDRKRTEEALRESQAKLETSLASIADAVFISDREGRFVNFNDAFATFHRFGNREECARTLVEYPGILDVFMANGESAPLDMWAVPRALRGETATNALYSLRRKDTGETWYGSYSFAPIRDKDGMIVGSVVVARDVTEQKEAEKALQDSMEEKTALLREVHHRVKNNLQIVASLLNLQASRTRECQVIELLRETRDRVHSMALLHEVLYRSGSLASINFSAYVGELRVHLLRSFGAQATGVRVENRVGRISLPMEQSVPCGLIINELVTNALKYAFPDDRPGRVIIDLGPADKDMLLLSVIDDGIGFSSGIDLSAIPTLGLRLVSNLASQLGGSLTIEKLYKGTGFSVTFPVLQNTLLEGGS
jgi:PAS domain S-box-containing protein